MDSNKSFTRDLPSIKHYIAKVLWRVEANIYYEQCATQGLRPQPQFRTNIATYKIYMPTNGIIHYSLYKQGLI